jgi:hypothetical protein
LPVHRGATNGKLQTANCEPLGTFTAGTRMAKTV